MNRIQKLLLYEYRDLDDTVLIESPFAQINPHGLGIRQVQLALTPTKMIIACDYINVSYPQRIWYYSKNIDPEIETLELATVFPLHFISMQVYRKGHRKLLKIELCTKQILLFEFGGLLLRNTNWNIWKDMIDNLRIHNNKLPCAAYLSQSSSNESNDIYQSKSKEHSTSISTNALINEFINGAENENISESSNLCKKTNHLSKESKSSLFRKITNIFSKQSACNLPITPSISGDEKCKEYLKQIDNISLYGAVDLEKW